MASAQDGEILIRSGAIAARVGGAFTLEDLGLRSFENVGDPVPVVSRRRQRLPRMRPSTLEFMWQIT